MISLLNTDRPPIFCPGCSHKQVVYALDEAFKILRLIDKNIVIISDIGCSGLFDTFFNTHAMHGLHGRALTYAAGIKMVKPNMNVIVVMGDGGIGIGGVHFLAACKRNLNLNLLVLNNFNFGMTGGQFSFTTPSHASVNSGFLNEIEKPIDVCEVAEAAGAPYVMRCSAYDKKISEYVANAISYEGMAVLDIHGICPGRYSKKNLLTPNIIKKNLLKLSAKKGEVSKNIRQEYRHKYFKTIKSVDKSSLFYSISANFEPIKMERCEIMILGSAGQRVVTAGEVLCYAALTAGISAIQKNDYPITVLRGHSVSDIVLSTQEINYAGINKPNFVIAISKDGVNRRKDIFKFLSYDSLIIADKSLNIPEHVAVINRIDFASMGIKHQDRAIASLVVLAKMKKIINFDMLEKAINIYYSDKIHKKIIEIVKKIKISFNA